MPPYPDLSDPSQMYQFAGRLAQYTNWQNPAPSEYTDPMQLNQLASQVADHVWRSPGQNPGSGTTGYPGSATGYPSGNYRSNVPASIAPSGSVTGAPGSPMDASALLRLYGGSQPDIRRSPIFSNQFMDAHPALGGALNNAMLSAALTPE